MSNWKPYRPAYKGTVDDRMWGAQRRVGYVIGGMPLPVFQHLCRDLIGSEHQPVTRTTPNFFSLTRPDLAIEFLRGDPVTLPRATVEAWLMQHYPDGVRMGYAHTSGLPRR